MKISKASKKLLSKLDNIKESLHYFAGNSEYWEDLNHDFKELEDYLIENSISTKLHNARFKKKLDIISKITKEKGELDEHGE